MKGRGLGAMVACMLLHAAFADGGASDHADRVERGDVIEIADGVLTLRVDGSPLGTVLEALAHESGVSIRSAAPIAETITANLRGVALDEGLTRLLGGRSAVFVYSNDGAAGHRPRLVEVHVYAHQASGSRSSPTPSADHQRPAESAENAASTGGADRTLARVSGRAEDQLDPERSPTAVQRLSRALSQEHDPSARARAAIALGRIGGDEAIAKLAVSIATDSETAVREAAAIALGRTWSEQAVAPLVRALLDDQRFFVREAAARALGETWSQSAVEALARALSLDPRPSVREAAAEALGKIGDPATVDSLVAALGDEHSTVRESAAAALGGIGRRDTVGALVEAARTDPDPWVRQDADAAVAKLMSSHDDPDRRDHRRRHRSGKTRHAEGKDHLDSIHDLASPGR